MDKLPHAVFAEGATLESSASLTDMVNLLGQCMDLRELEAQKRDLDEQKGLVSVLIKSLIGSAGEIHKNIKRREKHQEKAEQDRKKALEATNKARGIADQEEHKESVALAGRAQAFQVNLQAHQPVLEHKVAVTQQFPK